MTLILLILWLNTALFITLLVNTAKATKENQDKYLEIKKDNEIWKTKVMVLLKDIISKEQSQTEKLSVINGRSEIIELWVIELQNLLHKNR